MKTDTPHTTVEGDARTQDTEVELRICTKTGIHTCRRGSIHLNEREKVILEEHLNTHHQQLQKARQDWLREEIVTLKAVQRDFIARWEHPDSGLPLENETKSETLYHLQTIIDRYHSELDQDITK